MNKAQTTPAKYIFFDVVGFSQGRSVEAQTDIVDALNKLVLNTLTANEVALNQVILLPTGDGICIALLNMEDPFDIHLRLALDLLERQHHYNQSVENDMRKFQIRIGINANTDNLVTDINGNRNIAGAGINMAQRIMNKADGNQVLVGQSVFETLHVRESYINSFRSYRTKIKHGTSIEIHQFIDESRVGLNTDVPQAFVIEEEVKPTLTLRVACYFAHLIKNRSLIIRHVESSAITMKIIFWSRAGACAGMFSRIGGVVIPIYGSLEEQEASFDRDYRFYWKVPDSVQFEFAMMIQHYELFPYREYFEETRSALY